MLDEALKMKGSVGGKFADPVKDIPSAEALQLCDKVGATELEELAEVGLEIEATAKQTDRQWLLPYLGVSRESGEWILEPLRGRTIDGGPTAQQPIVELVAGRRVCKTGFWFWQMRDWNRAEPAALAQKREGGNFSAGAQSIQYEMPVILTNTVPQPKMFFQPFMLMLHRRGHLGWQDALERKSLENVTLYDDPHIPGARGSSHLDAEGVLAQKLTVDQEFLKAFLSCGISSEKKRISTACSGEVYWRYTVHNSDGERVIRKNFANS